MSETLYQHYGGFGTVSRIVIRLYDHILDDNDIGPFFEDVDMPRLIDHQTKFVASLMGGPAAFTDAHLRGAHRGLGIDDSHFDRLKELVAQTLEESGIAPDHVAEVLEGIEARRRVLVEAEDA